MRKAGLAGLCAVLVLGLCLPALAQAPAAGSAESVFRSLAQRHAANQAIAQRMAALEQQIVTLLLGVMADVPPGAGRDTVAALAANAATLAALVLSPAPDAAAGEGGLAGLVRRNVAMAEAAAEALRGDPLLAPPLARNLAVQLEIEALSAALASGWAAYGDLISRRGIDILIDADRFDPQQMAFSLVPPPAGEGPPARLAAAPEAPPSPLPPPPQVVELPQSPPPAPPTMPVAVPLGQPALPSAATGGDWTVTPLAGGGAVARSRNLNPATSATLLSLSIGCAANGTLQYVVDAMSEIRGVEIGAGDRSFGIVVADLNTITGSNALAMSDALTLAVEEAGRAGPGERAFFLRTVDGEGRIARFSTDGYVAARGAVLGACLDLQAAVLAGLDVALPAEEAPAASPAAPRAPIPAPRLQRPGG